MDVLAALLLVVLLCMLGLLALIVWLLTSPSLTDEPPPTVTPPEPLVARTLVAPPPDITPVKPPPSQLTIRFIDERGRELGKSRITSVYRKPTMQWRDKRGKLGNFLADSCQGQTWTYRRVGIDRE